MSYSRTPLHVVEELRANGKLVLGVNSTKRRRQYVRISAEDRFMAKVEKRSDGCWLWQAAKSPKGYGVFARVDGVKTEMAHRSSYIMFVGEIPKGMLVCHHCDTPSCVNPAHLFLGTAADNTADMMRKWRTKSKLTPEQVEEIRNAKGTSREVAARYGFKAHGTILNIWRGRTFSKAAA